jgi:F0F1-type ATP synthase gamma subunit
MLLKNNQEEEYSILLKAVKNEVFHFIVVQYNHYSLVRETQSLIQETYPNKKTQKINLLEEPAENLTALLLEDNSDIFLSKTFRFYFRMKTNPLLLELTNAETS